MGCGGVLKGCIDVTAELTLFSLGYCDAMMMTTADSVEELDSKNGWLVGWRRPGQVEY